MMSMTTSTSLTSNFIKMQIPFLDLKSINEPHLEEVSQSIIECISSGWYVLGKQVEKFEKNYAAFCGATYCVGLANGLDAITLLLKAYDFPAGSEVIVPANTYIASILGILNAGLTPILVEPNPANYLLNEDLIEDYITNNTKAILAVELYGKCGNLTKLRSIADRHNLKLISDNAQSHGATFLGKPSIDLLDAATYSFYPTKNLGAMGDAGAVISNDFRIIERLKYLRNYGSLIKYQFDYQGINSRLDEIQATILSVKLPYLANQLSRRRLVAKRYLTELKPTFISLPPADTVDEDAWHLFVIRSTDREVLREYLKEKGIGTDIHYPVPPHKQPAMSDWKHLSFPITEKVHREILSIPMNHVLTDEQVTYIITTLNAFKP